MAGFSLRQPATAVAAFRIGALALCVAVLSACTAKAPEPHAPSAFGTLVDPTSGVRRNWPLAPAEAEQRLETSTIEIRRAADAGSGVTGAMRLTLWLPEDGVEVDAKWKPVPRGNLDSWNNAPRKELAAAAVQRWILEPNEWVVPATVLRCLPRHDLCRAGACEPPTFAGGDCVLGVLSLWLRDVEVPARLYDPRRFAADPAYAYHLAGFNLLTYLIDHRDGRSGNFLVSEGTANRRVFAVDNGISFGPWIYNYFVRNWNDVRVPALRRDSLAKLRRIGDAQLDALGVVAELRDDGSGRPRPSEPGPNLDPERGVRRASRVVQLGLTVDEIEDLRERIAELLEKVDEGDLAVF